MAEGLLTRLWPQQLHRHVVIESAGTHAAQGLPAEPHAVRAAGELGADIGAHRSRALDPVMVEKADLILAMTQQQVRVIRSFDQGKSELVRLLGEFGPDKRRIEVPDPYGGSLETYRQCAFMIHGFLVHLMSELEVKVEDR